MLAESLIDQRHMTPHNSQITTPQSGDITAAEIHCRLTDDDWVLVNVMPHGSFLAGRIPRSINLPLGDLAALAPQRLPRLDQEIALYCAGPT